MFIDFEYDVSFYILVLLPISPPVTLFVLHHYHRRFHWMFLCPLLMRLLMHVTFHTRGHEVVMNAQNTHHIPSVYHVFGTFHTLISVFIALYLILSYLCISGKNGGIWSMCGGLKKQIRDSSPKVATFQHSNIITSRRLNVATLRSEMQQPNVATSPVLSQ